MADCQSYRRPRSRFLPDERTPMRLTDRDIHIVKEVFASRLLTRDHLIALGYLPSVGRANQTLRRLFDHRYLRRIFPELGPFGSQAIYGVGSRSADFLAVEYGIERAEVLALTRKLPARLHIEHTLKVADFRLQLMAFCSEKGYTLRWLPEVFARHEYRVQVRGRWTDRVLKPDAFASVQSPYGVQHFLVEIDLGHVSRPQWERTLLHYREHASMGLVDVAYNVPEATVLTVTSGGELRLKHLMESVPSPTERFFFTTFERLGRFGLDGPSCLRAGYRNEISLLGSGERVEVMA